MIIFNCLCSFYFPFFQGSKAKPKHYLALLVREGKLKLIVRGRRRRELALAAHVADGTWRAVSAPIDELLFVVYCTIAGFYLFFFISVCVGVSTRGANAACVGEWWGCSHGARAAARPRRATLRRRPALVRGHAALA